MATLRCRKCGSALDVHYLKSPAEATGAQPPGWVGPPVPLPLHDQGAWVSLGEGNTPTVALPAIGELLGLNRLFAKLEFLNPTGSFKDRGTAVMMSVAREHGVTEVVEDSSGNAGASVSAYAARAGVKAHVFAPASAPQAKIQQIKVYGAEAHPIEGSREAVTQAAIAYYTERRLVYASHNLSPYFIEGTKTFAYEAAQQLGGHMPDHIVVPVGNGSLFIGAWKGFRELQDAGRLSRMPRLHCIQARAVMPIVAAYTGEEWSAKVGARTIAGGISVGAPPRKQQVLDVLRASGGVALAVEDQRIVHWQRLLAEKEGIYAEPTSAAALAGLEELTRLGEVKSDDLVLVPITGFGLKDAPPV
jgi:threonine synthase